MALSKRKVESIYALRKAAEEKAHAERTAAERPSSETRDDLLDAQLDLEQKTVEAIEACHECGVEHEKGTPHRFAHDDNVIPLRREPTPDDEPASDA